MMFEKDSPIWPIISSTIKYSVFGLVIVWGLSTGYKEGWVARADVPVLLKILGGFAGINVAGLVGGKILDKVKKEES